MKKPSHRIEFIAETGGASGAGCQQQQRTLDAAAGQHHDLERNAEAPAAERARLERDNALRLGREPDRS